MVTASLFTRRSTPEDPTKAHRIQTEIIPRYEVTVTELGLDPKDRPAMRRMVDEGWLDMTRLAEMDPGELGQALHASSMTMPSGSTSRGIDRVREITGFYDPGKDAIERCEDIQRRLRKE